MLCQHIIVCRDSEIAPTDGLLSRDSEIAPTDGLLSRDSEIAPTDGLLSRDSEIAPTDGLLRVGGNSDSRLLSKLSKIQKHGSILPCFYLSKSRYCQIGTISAK